MPHLRGISEGLLRGVLFDVLRNLLFVLLWPGKKALVSIVPLVSTPFFEELADWGYARISCGFRTSIFKKLESISRRIRHFEKCLDSDFGSRAPDPKAEFFIECFQFNGKKFFHGTKPHSGLFFLQYKYFRTNCLEKAEISLLRTGMLG